MLRNTEDEFSFEERKLLLIPSNPCTVKIWIFMNLKTANLTNSAFWNGRFWVVFLPISPAGSYTNPIYILVIDKMKVFSINTNEKPHLKLHVVCVLLLT